MVELTPSVPTGGSPAAPGPPTLFAHPFSSYSQKVLIALYETRTPFAWRPLVPEQPENHAELSRLWPPATFPLLVDEGRPIPEASVIIEHLQMKGRWDVRIIPEAPEAALEVRLLDRVFDVHVSAAVQRAVGDALRPRGRQDPGVREAASAALDRVYGWLDPRLQGREWAAGGFSLADCAAAPALFYADWVQPIAPEFAALSAYRARLLSRPSIRRVVEEARPYRPLFPLGAPDRD